MGGAGDFPSAPPGLTLSDSMKFKSQDGLLLAWSPQPRTAWLDLIKPFHFHIMGRGGTGAPGKGAAPQISSAECSETAFETPKHPTYSLCHYFKIYLFTTLVVSCWNEEITLVAGSEYWAFKVFPCLKSSKNSAFSLLSSSARLLMSLGRTFLPLASCIAWEMTLLHAWSAWWTALAAQMARAASFCSVSSSFGLSGFSKAVASKFMICSSSSEMQSELFRMRLCCSQAFFLRSGISIFLAINCMVCSGTGSLLRRFLCRQHSSGHSKNNWQKPKEYLRASWYSS